MQNAREPDAGSWLDDAVLLLALGGVANRPEHVRAYFAELRSAPGVEQDEAFRKEFTELKKVFKAGLYHEAWERAQRLQERQPKHPLLALLLAQTCLELKKLDEAAAQLYRAEYLGLPEEVMLQMKARYCEAAADEVRSAKLRTELQEVIETQEKKTHQERVTAHAASSLTYAWLGALAGFAAAVVGSSGLLLYREGSSAWFFGVLAVLGVAGLVSAVRRIQRHNKVLADSGDGARTT